jgi:hypothetical protein
MERPSSPSRNLEPDFGTLDRIAEESLPKDLVIDYKIFLEDICIALKVHNLDGYSFFVIKDRIPLTMEPGDVLVKEKMTNRIDSSCKKGIISMLDLDTAGVVFEKSSEIVFVERFDYHYRERSYTKENCRLETGQFSIYPSFFFDDISYYLSESVRRASIIIKKNFLTQSFENIKETAESMSGCLNIINSYEDKAKTFLDKCEGIIQSINSVIKQWDGVESEDKEFRLTVLRENLYRKRKMEMDLLSFNKIVSEKREFYEKSTTEIGLLCRELEKMTEGIHLITFPSNKLF